MDVEEYLSRFEEEPGYLDFARFGPVGRTVLDEAAAYLPAVAHARFGSAIALGSQDERVREAVAAVTGFPTEQTVFQESAAAGLLQVMFGMAGVVAVSPTASAALAVAARRAADALETLAVRWIEPDHGLVTAGTILRQLDEDVTAVAVSLVDPRSGHLVDLDGVRQVIGDRLLVVDATHALGAVDAPLEFADALVAGGANWARAGWGTGFLALSARALEELRPVWSGPGNGVLEDEPSEVGPPARAAGSFTAGAADPLAQLRLAVALGELAEVDAADVAARVADRVDRLLALADERGIPVVSPRAETERAGIVVLEPDPGRIAMLSAALHNHGITASLDRGRLRLSPHASTSDETLAMVESAFLASSTTVPV